MAGTPIHQHAARLSEKTIEVNFCTQVNRALADRPMWWYGLTQAKEAELGWDVATAVDGWWALFQVKASNHVLAAGARRFRGAHHQLVALQEGAEAPGEVFYVLPTIGNVDELVQAKFDLLANLRLLDVTDVPELGPPTKTGGSLRKNGIHYLDLDTARDQVTIHSDPVHAEVRPFAALYEIMTVRRSTDREVGDRTVDPGPERRRRRLDLARRFVTGARHRVAAFLPD